MSFGAVRITVFCDGPLCRGKMHGSIEEVELTETSHGWDARGVDAELVQMGWVVQSDGTYCQNCVEEMGLEEEDEHYCYG
jgi:hypothetical protein